VIFSRSLRSHQAVARHNALTATRALRQRRAEREEVERFLADLHDTGASETRAH
jgi:hypothetical protein